MLQSEALGALTCLDFDYIPVWWAGYHVRHVGVELHCTLKYLGIRVPKRTDINRDLHTAVV